MNIRIHKAKYIKARDISEAQKIIRKKYPYAKIITYKFDKDMRFEVDKDYENRTMSVWYVRDIKKLREEL